MPLHLYCPDPAPRSCCLKSVPFSSRSLAICRAQQLRTYVLLMRQPDSNAKEKSMRVCVPLVVMPSATKFPPLCLFARTLHLCRKLSVRRARRAGWPLAVSVSWDSSVTIVAAVTRRSQGYYVVTQAMTWDLFSQGFEGRQSKHKPDSRNGMVVARESSDIFVLI